MIGIAARAPVSLFGIVLGLAGLGNAWRLAHAVWNVPGLVGEATLGLATCVWLGLLALYATKWLTSRAIAIAEFQHPVQSCFVAFVPMSTMLIAVAARPYAAEPAFYLLVLGSIASGAFAVCHTGRLTKGGRDPAAVTPALVLPTVGFGYVSAIGLGAFGLPGLGQLLFGMGFLAWLPIEAAVRFRLYALPEMAPPLRPSLGILVAPPAVGAVSYLSTAGTPDRFATFLIGYGMLQVMLLARLLRWIAKQQFAASWWAFGFGIDALAIAPMMSVLQGSGTPLQGLAVGLFVFANLVIGALTIGTLGLIAQGRLLPRST